MPVTTRNRPSAVLILLTALSLLTGCATCREHPVACGIGTAVLIGAIVASTQGHHENTPGSPCGGHPYGCRP